MQSPPHLFSELQQSFNKYSNEKKKITFKLNLNIAIEYSYNNEKALIIKICSLPHLFRHLQQPLNARLRLFPGGAIHGQDLHVRAEQLGNNRQNNKLILHFSIKYIYNNVTSIW